MGRHITLGRLRKSSRKMVKRPASRASAGIRRPRARHPEDDLQASLIAWHRRCVPRHQAIVYSVPNGDLRDPFVVLRLKETGMLPGAADLIVLLPGGRIWLPEVKTDKTALTSKTYQNDNQKLFEADARALGHDYTVVRSLEDYAQGLMVRGVQALAWPPGVFGPRATRPAPAPLAASVAPPSAARAGADAANPERPASASAPAHPAPTPPAAAGWDASPTPRRR